MSALVEALDKVARLEQQVKDMKKEHETLLRQFRQLQVDVKKLSANFNVARSRLTQVERK